MVGHVGRTGCRLAATKRSDSGTKSESAAAYAVNKWRKDIDNNLAIQGSAIVAKDDRPGRVMRTMRSRLAVADSPCWLNSKIPQHDRVAEPGGNHGRCAGEGADGSRNAMGGWPVTVEIAFAATLS